MEKYLVAMTALLLSVQTAQAMDSASQAIEEIGEQPGSAPRHLSKDEIESALKVHEAEQMQRYLADPRVQAIALQRTSSQRTLEQMRIDMCVAREEFAKNPQHKKLEQEELALAREDLALYESYGTPEGRKLLGLKLFGYR